ncbi:MAG: folylpolyglutamate synthase/dihydrofolate synthase family protein [Verrucomicrobiota bacterium]
MNYAEAVRFLYGLQLFGAKFGLQNTRKLAALAGNPQEKLRFIHVAGTNGKGSTCAMLESIYRASGLRTGLFTSPHLVSFAERIQVNRVLATESEIAVLVEEMIPLLKKFPRATHPTFFEVVTVMALKYFRARKCDLVIWETGMGGRLDATNIVTPLASVITNVQFDHEKWLGNSLKDIAFEKAGIIKEGVPVVTATGKPEALEVIKKIADEKNSPLIRVTRTETKKMPLRRIKVSLPGEHQRLNAALAIAATQVLHGQIPVTEPHLVCGLSGVRWDGRLQLIQKNGRTFLLDGAHNPSGAQALVKTLAEIFPRKKITLILGALADKQWESMGKILAPLAKKIMVVPVSSERTVFPGDLNTFFQRLNGKAEIRSCRNLKEGIASTRRGEFVLISGSLYLIGEALELLQPENIFSPDERGLNEWSAPKRSKR